MARPGLGLRRRNVSPPGVPQPMQIVEVHFPPRGRVAFETGGRDMRVHQQVWVLEGAIDITLGVERHRLREGDCLAMQLDRPTMFHNPTRKPARYAVVIAPKSRESYTTPPGPETPAALDDFRIDDLAGVLSTASKAFVGAYATCRATERWRSGAGGTVAGPRATRVWSPKMHEACVAPCSCARPAREPTAPRRAVGDLGISAPPPGLGRR